MFEKPLACESCPAYSVGKSYVPGTGSKEAKLAIVGQGPGEREAYAGLPFVGPSGSRLDTWIYRAGLERHRLWIDNVVRCWLPKNRAPTMAEREFCWQAHVGPALTDLPNLKVVVPAGVPAMEVFLGRSQSGERAAGSATRLASLTRERTPGAIHSLGNGDGTNGEAGETDDGLEEGCPGGNAGVS